MAEDTTMRAERQLTVKRLEAAARAVGSALRMRIGVARPGASRC